MNITAHTHVGNLGQTVTEFLLTELPAAGESQWEDLTPSDFYVEDAWVDVSCLVPSDGVIDVGHESGMLRLRVDPFRYLASDFSIYCPRGGLRIGKAEITQVVTRTVDDFKRDVRDGVPYRLYTPPQRLGDPPPPLVLFLHGGGEGGTDNELQLTGTLGAAAWAEQYPDVMVLAPQNPVSWEEVRAALQAGGDRARALPGWSGETLDTVAGLIGELTAVGMADPKRIYVSGMSMGGAGTLRILARHRDLFAAAAPICPSMNDETVPYLESLVDLPIWISTAYRDTFPDRHLKIIAGIERLQDAGNQKARYTLYSIEELAAFGLGKHPKLTDEQRWAENHHSWVLTLNNVYGIMDWVLSHVRDEDEDDD